MDIRRMLYYSFEVIFRGFSHWSMFILGGICFVFFAIQGKMVHWQDALWRQLLRCIVFVTAMEFITGIIVNKWLGLAVWDYSDQLPALRADMPAIYGYIFRPVRSWDPVKRLSYALALWG